VEDGEIYAHAPLLLGSGAICARFPKCTASTNFAAAMKKVKPPNTERSAQRTMLCQVETKQGETVLLVGSEQLTR
jgi:hypothetical protein